MRSLICVIALKTANVGKVCKSIFGGLFVFIRPSLSLQALVRPFFGQKMRSRQGADQQ
jgi:hypothetical protein